MGNDGRTHGRDASGGSGHRGRGGNQHVYAAGSSLGAEEPAEDASAKHSSRSAGSSPAASEKEGIFRETQGCFQELRSALAICGTLKAMNVHFTPEQEAKLAQIATKNGTAPEQLVTNVVARYLDEEARFLAAVQKGIAAAERGEFIEEEEMDARLEAMFKV
jgi:predicted transcriptional regulator